MQLTYHLINGLREIQPCLWPENYIKSRDSYGELIATIDIPTIDENLTYHQIVNKYPCPIDTKKETL